MPIDEFELGLAIVTFKTREKQGRPSSKLHFLPTGEISNGCQQQESQLSLWSRKYVILSWECQKQDILFPLSLPSGHIDIVNLKLSKMKLYLLVYIRDVQKHIFCYTFV